MAIRAVPAAPIPLALAPCVAEDPAANCAADAGEVVAAPIAPWLPEVLTCTIAVVVPAATRRRRRHRDSTRFANRDTLSVRLAITGWMGWMGRIILHLLMTGATTSATASAASV